MASPFPRPVRRAPQRKPDPEPPPAPKVMGGPIVGYDGAVAAYDGKKARPGKGGRASGKVLQMLAARAGAVPPSTSMPGNAPMEAPEPTGQPPVYDGEELLGYDSYMQPTPAGAVAPPGQTSAQPGGPPTPGGQPGGFPQGAWNVGGPMYPWLMPYSGPRTAPVSGWSQGAMQGLGNELGGPGGQNQYQWGQGGPGGNNWQWQSSPWLDQAQGGAQKLKDIMDQRAHQQIASSMAAGGLGLSGARGNAEQQYQNQSDAQFQNMVGNMRNQDWQQGQHMGQATSAQNAQLQYERDLAAARGGDTAAQRRMQGYGQMFGMGELPQQTEQNQYTADYNDWLRQIGGFQNQFNQPFQQSMQLMNQRYPGYQQPNYAPSQGAETAALLSQLFGGGGSGGGQGEGLVGGLSDLYQQLFGGGTDTTGTTATGGSEDPNHPSYYGWQDQPQFQWQGNEQFGPTGFPEGYDTGQYYTGASEGYDGELVGYDGEEMQAPDRSRMSYARQMFGPRNPGHWNRSAYRGSPDATTPLGYLASRWIGSQQWNPGWGGRSNNPAEPFGGAYGFSGFTRGTNTDPYQNPHVGDYNWFRSGTGAQDAFGYGHGNTSDPGLNDFLGKPGEGGMRDFLGNDPGHMSTGEMDERFRGGSGEGERGSMGFAF